MCCYSRTLKSLLEEDRTAPCDTVHMHDGRRTTPLMVMDSAICFAENPMPPTHCEHLIIHLLLVHLLLVSRLRPPQLQQEGREGADRLPASSFCTTIGWAGLAEQRVHFLVGDPDWAKQRQRRQRQPRVLC